MGKDKKLQFDPSTNTLLKDELESQQSDFFKQQQEYFCGTFNPKDFEHKFSSILDKAVEEDQKFDKQIQDNVELLKNTLLIMMDAGRWDSKGDTELCNASWEQISIDK